MGSGDRQRVEALRRIQNREMEPRRPARLLVVVLALLTLAIFVGMWLLWL